MVSSILFARAAALEILEAVTARLVMRMSWKPCWAKVSAWLRVETATPPTVPGARSCMWAIAGDRWDWMWGRSLGPES